MKYSKEELDKLIAEAPRDEKGRPIISDEDFMDNLGDLPDGTRTEGGKYAAKGGYVQAGRKGDPQTYENCKKAWTASVESREKRKTFAETIDILLRQKDKNGVTTQEKIVLAMAEKASSGCVGAFEALRDTVGEKPTDNVALDVMTDGDKALMEKLLKRMGYDESANIKK